MTLAVALAFVGAGGTALWWVAVRDRTNSWSGQLGLVFALNALDRRSGSNVVQLDEVTLRNEALSEFSCSISLCAARGGNDLGRFVLDAPLGERAARCGEWGREATPLLLARVPEGGCCLHAPGHQFVGELVPADGVSREEWSRG